MYNATPHTSISLQSVHYTPYIYHYTMHISHFAENSTVQTSHCLLALQSNAKPNVLYRTQILSCCWLNLMSAEISLVHCYILFSA